MLFCQCAFGGQPHRAAMVEWDWYFRESLQAIDDWEAILAEREKQEGSESLKVVYPVPVDGTPAGVVESDSSSVAAAEG